MLMEWNGVPLDEPYLRDTINVAYWDGKSRGYPSVKLRMDFANRQWSAPSFITAICWNTRTAG